MAAEVPCHVGISKTASEWKDRACQRLRARVSEIVFQLNEAGISGISLENFGDSPGVLSVGTSVNLKVDYSSTRLSRDGRTACHNRAKSEGAEPEQKPPTEITQQQPPTEVRHQQQQQQQPPTEITHHNEDDLGPSLAVNDAPDANHPIARDGNDDLEALLPTDWHREGEDIQRSPTPPPPPGKPPPPESQSAVCMHGAALGGDFSSALQPGMVSPGVSPDPLRDSGAMTGMLMIPVLVSYYPMMVVPMAVEGVPQGAYEGQCYRQLDQAACREDHYMKGRVWEFSKDANGTFWVQHALQNASDHEEIVELVSEFQGHVGEAVKCPHANHALQAAIEEADKFGSNAHSQFIIDEFTLDEHTQLISPEKVVAAAKHEYGCRIMQRLLESCTPEQMAQIVEILLSHFPGLMQHKYAHYVILHLFKYGSLHGIWRLISGLEEQVPTMMANACFAAMLDKALEKNTIETMAQSDSGLVELVEACAEARRSLAVSLLQMPQRFVSMADSRFGSKAATLALGLASDSERQTIRAAFRAANDLQSGRYGKKVVKHLDGLLQLPALRNLFRLTAQRAATLEDLRSAHLDSWLHDEQSLFCSHAIALLDCGIAAAYLQAFLDSDKCTEEYREIWRMWVEVASLRWVTLAREEAG